MNRRLIFFCVVILLLNATWYPRHVTAQQSKSAQEEDIREAVLRFQMENWIRESDKDEATAKDQSEKEIAHALNFEVFFVSTGKKDPSDEFVKRFKDVPRTVKKASSAEISKEVRMPVVDKETQKRGIIFSVDSIRWLEKSHVKVEGGYHCDGLCGAGYTFDVRFEKEKWVVRKERLNWVS
jgi:hypothetical protein